MVPLEIKCPACKEILMVDPATGKILEHKSSEKPKLGLDEFMKSQKSRGSELDSMFKKAKEDHAKRKEELDAQFKKAREHPEELQGDMQSPFQWD